MSAKNQTINTNDTTTILLKDAEYGLIRTSYIEFSPLNYRKYFSEDSLNAFAAELKQHGMISPVTLRLRTDGKYELVAGERRLRAARIAGLEAIPSAIVTLSDEQVIEIQLAENIQRENPHPMQEAQGIGQLQQQGKTIEEIAARLGKSKQFVYARLKLLLLTESFQEMLLADAITLNEAFKISSLSAESQTDFFKEHCTKWKKDKTFNLDDLDWYLTQYRYDLKKAPFNIKDKALVAEAGACTNCPSNSGSLKTLFPELAKQAVCSNKQCYNNKCQIHFLNLLATNIDAYQPTALIYFNQINEQQEKMLQLIPAAAELPRYNYPEITTIQKPETPDKEDYSYGEEEELDEQEFNQAMDDYYTQLESYNLHVKSGHYQVALLIDNKTFAPVYFNLEKPKQTGSRQQTISAKEVQAAIKEGTVTTDILLAEIERLKEKENRSEQLDKEKVHLTIHSQFTETVNKPENNKSLTEADKIVARLIIFQSLNYNSRKQVAENLFSAKDTKSNETFYNRLAGLSNQEYAYLIRMAICSKSDSKFPGIDTGHFLFQLAKSAGFNVAAIEKEQDVRIKERKEKLKVKLKDLKKQADKLKVK